VQQQSSASTQPQNAPAHYPQFLSESAMRHYFYKMPQAYLWLLIAGASISLIGLLVLNLFGNSFLIAGLILAAIGGIPLFVYYENRPTDEQYMQWVSERLQPLYKKALQRLHLDESQCENIIEIQGGFSSLLQLTRKFPEKEIAVKRLSNGFRNYSINVCTYIFLTKDDIAIYSGYINALAQIERFEDADHYYYKDIVGVSTSGPIYTSRDRPGSSSEEIQRQGFFVRISNGEVVGTDYATKVLLVSKKQRIEIKGVDDVVAALLALLRDHNVTLMEANRIAQDIS
jgi:hypothetical protein